MSCKDDDHDYSILKQTEPETVGVAYQIERMTVSLLCKKCGKTETKEVIRKGEENEKYHFDNLPANCQEFHLSRRKRTRQRILNAYVDMLKKQDKKSTKERGDCIILCKCGNKKTKKSK